MPRVAWLDKTFDLQVSEARFVSLRERLRSAPERLENRVRTLPDAERRSRPADGWSVQEHAGHLLDLEDLHLGRLRDYAARRPTLRPADFSNRRTYEAHHHDTPTEEILADFRFARDAFLRGVDALDPACSARHPRLGCPMGVGGLMAFVAAHDDHHLEEIEVLVAQFGMSEAPR